jgi:hypothetical protein
MVDAAPSTATAIAAYRASQQLDRRPLAILARVYDELRLALASAIAAYERRALDQMCRHAGRATQILLVLDAALDLAPPETAGLQRFHRRLRQAVNRLLIDDSAIPTIQAGAIQLNSMSAMFLAAKNQHYRQ